MPTPQAPLQKLAFTTIVDEFTATLHWEDGAAGCNETGTPYDKSPTSRRNSHSKIVWRRNINDSRITWKRNANFYLQVAFLYTFFFYPEDCYDFARRKRGRRALGHKYRPPTGYLPRGNSDNVHNEEERCF